MKQRWSYRLECNLCSSHDRTFLLTKLETTVAFNIFKASSLVNDLGVLYWLTEEPRETKKLISSSKPPLLTTLISNGPMFLSFVLPFLYTESRHSLMVKQHSSITFCRVWFTHFRVWAWSFAVLGQDSWCEVQPREAVFQVNPKSKVKYCVGFGVSHEALC